MFARVERLEKEVADLREHLGKNSGNSSKPPSSDPPGTSSPPSKGSTRKRGAQRGHTKHSCERLLADRVVDCVSETCAHCEHPLEGHDPER